MNPSKTSEWGARLLQQEEGTRLRAYKDTVGVWTIGVGHTGRMSPPPVTKGMQITERQAAEFLAADLAPVEAAIVAKVKVPITQSMFDALASFAFNVGVGGFGKSTLLRKLNAGDYGAAGQFVKDTNAPGGWRVESDGTGAAGQFLAWTKQVELTGRRIREQALFLKDGIPGRAPAPASARKPAPQPVVATYPGGDIPLPGAAPAPVKAPALTKPQIESLQRRLDELGYKEVGIIDGRWGRKTRGALSSFQLDNDLPGTGVLDDATLRLLPIAEPRPVSEERQRADTKFVDKVAPGALAPVRANVNVAKAGIGALGLGFIGDAVSKVTDVLSPVRDFLSDLPGWVWMALVAGGLALVLVNAVRGKQVLVDLAKSDKLS